MKKNDPQSQLVSFVDRLRKTSQNLFSFTTSEAEFITRDKGLYAYLLAKPSKRLASTLAVDRELLILCSPFEDQQQRTIKTAREVIDSYEGRLESGIAIIVHNDRDGNAKLQKWGRSTGIAVLPLYAGRMPSNGEELEHYLCHELFSHDPFDITGPVSDDENFFGRRNEALDLARKLQTGQIRSCLGIRKIGKTSVINRVIAEARRQHDCYCVMLDCSRDQVWSQTSASLTSALAEAVDGARSSPDRYATVGAPKALRNMSDASDSLLKSIERSDKPVLIFIDEVDYITPGSPTQPAWAQEFNPFWRNFRAAYQETMRRGSVVSVMIVGVSSKWFAVGSIDGIENAALAFVPEEYLSPLARGATNAMIRTIARSAGLVFTDETANIVAAACSDMPFWVRKACSFIHRQIEIPPRPTKPEPASVNELVVRFIEEEGATLAQVAVAHLFRVYPELEGPALACLSLPDKYSAQFAPVLRKYGILAPTEPIRTSGDMVKNALNAYKEQRDNTTPASAQLPLSIGAGTTDKRALDDWADDLAVINKTVISLRKSFGAWPSISCGLTRSLPRSGDRPKIEFWRVSLQKGKVD
jgi:hypothetical protein